jgi:hypothetical protein
MKWAAFGGYFAHDRAILADGLNAFGQNEPFWSYFLGLDRG